MSNFQLYTDYGEITDVFVDLLCSATREVYYSCFTCAPTSQMYGQPKGTTLVKLLWEAWERSGYILRINILYNHEPMYNMMEPDEFVKLLPPAPFTTLKVVHTNGFLTPLLKPFMGNTRYSNHHQKYLCVDQKRVLLGGSEIEPERSGWLVKNISGYYWHETAVAFDCTRAMAHFFTQNFKHGPGMSLNFAGKHQKPPQPLFLAFDESAVMSGLIENARQYVHIENQTMCSIIGITQNQLFRSIGKRLVQAYQKHKKGYADPIKFVLISNWNQPDEGGLVTIFSTHSFQYSLYALVQYCLDRNVPHNFIYGRIVALYAEYQEKCVKIHSNLLMVDGEKMYRSSSNINDRSLSDNPCDAELGVLIEDAEIVLKFQHKLLRMYMFGELASPTYFFRNVQVPEKTVFKSFNWSNLMYRSKNIQLFRKLSFTLVHKYLPAAGSTNAKRIHWKVEPISNTSDRNTHVSGFTNIEKTYMVGISIAIIALSTALMLYIRKTFVQRIKFK